MLFEGLSEKLQKVFKNLRGKGKLSEQDVNAALREVRLALLEADVNFKIVKEFVGKVKDRAVGEEVFSSITPAQQVIKIVHDELTDLMGGSQSKINISSKPPTVIMMVGLQGSGKTTTSAKLANMLRKKGKNPLLVAADIYRPAAIKQIQVLGEQLSVPVFSMGDKQKPANIALGAIEHATKNKIDTIIIDTAGRLHTDEDLMGELGEIKEAVNPHEIMLVVDATTGQDAVNVAESFNERLELSGILLTKLDGDTRGGAALSVKAVTGCPIKFVGIGEKLDAIEEFHPDRMAKRILGMGDVLTLIEKAQSAFDAEQTERLRKKLRDQEFSLEDFLEQLQEFKKLGPLDQIVDMIPGLSGMKKMKNLKMDEKELVYAEAVIKSMTPDERRHPEIIRGSRRKRIARGSGTTVHEVNKILKQYSQVKKMMKQIGDMEKSYKKGFKLPKNLF